MAVNWDDPATWNDPLIGGQTSADHWGRYPGGATKSIRVPGWFDWPHGFQMRGDYTDKQSLELNIGKSKSKSLIDTLLIPQNAPVVIVGAAFGPTVEGLINNGINVVGTDTSSFILAKIGENDEPEVRTKIVEAGYDPDTHIIYAFGRDSSHDLSFAGFTLRSDIRPNREGKFLWGIPVLDLICRVPRGLPARGPVDKVLAEGADTIQSRQTIANAVGGSLNNIISEYVLAGLTDAAVLDFCNNMAALSFDKGGIITHLVNVKRENNRGHVDMNWKTIQEWRTFLDANGFQDQELRLNETAGAFLVSVRLR